MLASTRIFIKNCIVYAALGYALVNYHCIPILQITGIVLLCISCFDLKDISHQMAFICKSNIVLVSTIPALGFFSQLVCIVGAYSYFKEHRSTLNKAFLFIFKFIIQVIIIMVFISVTGICIATAGFFINYKVIQSFSMVTNDMQTQSWIQEKLIQTMLDYASKANARVQLDNLQIQVWFITKKNIFFSVPLLWCRKFL